MDTLHLFDISISKNSGLGLDLDVERDRKLSILTNDNQWELYNNVYCNEW